MPFVFESLDDIAKHFEQKAKQVEGSVAETDRDRRSIAVQAATWKQAAYVLRNTTLKSGRA